VPHEFYKIEVYNTLSFAVIHCLNRAFRDCDKLLKDSGDNEYKNMIAIFYPFLTKLLTTYAFCKYEMAITGIEYGFELRGLMLSNEKSSIWPVNYSNVFERNYKPIGHEYHNVGYSSAVRHTRRLLNVLIQKAKRNTRRIANRGTPLVLISPNAGMNLKRLSNSLGWSVQNVNLYAKVFIPRWLQQFGKLIQSIEYLEKELVKSFPKQFEIDDEFLEFIESELLLYSNITKQNRMRANALVLGSLADLKCRINASIAKSESIPVISIWHGDSIGDKNEPQFGPVKQTFCNAILGYGDYGCQVIKSGSYNRGFYEQPTIIPGSSHNVMNIYQKERIETVANWDELEMMYVPTAFSGIERNMPFRDIHDIAYYSWQYNMLKCVINIMKPKKVIRKAHRKERIDYEFNLDSIEEIKKPDFMEVLAKADLFIFDYLTTAFTYAAATSKPIIYFDIGLRNAMPDALESIKERCIYVKGSPENAEVMVKEAYNNRSKESQNTYTERYSISQDRRTREEILVSIIRDYVINR